MQTPIQKYRIVQKRPEESQENEIRVKANARAFIYAAYAGKLLFEKKYDSLFMLATGTATSKVIQAVEFIRKRVRNLYVCYEIESTEFTDEYQPLVEGLDVVKVKRLVPTLKAHLFLDPSNPLSKKPGFMPALPPSEIHDEEKFKADIEEHFKKDRRGGEEHERRPYRGQNRRQDDHDGERPYRGRGSRFRGENQDQEHGDRPRNRENRGRFRDQGGDRPFTTENGEQRRGRGSGFRGDRGERRGRGNFNGAQGERNDNHGGFRGGNYRDDNPRGDNFNGERRRGRGRFSGNRGTERDQN